MESRKLFFVFCLVVLFLSLEVLAREQFSSRGETFNSGSRNIQYIQPTFEQLYSSRDSVDLNTIWPILDRMDKNQCEAASDFIIGIPPGGCSPSVVRSDLIAEQKVPVFCQLYAVRVNPLIEVSSIKTISFKGDYPKGVSGISFHPARAAVRSYRTLLGDPLINNIGYVVIILDQEKVEDNLEEWIAGNLTATIRYDAEGAYGTGRSEHYLSLNRGSEAGVDYSESSFWNGRGKVRLESIGSEGARISLYKGDEKITEVSLKEGETSGSYYFPGYYCRVGLKLKLNRYVAPEDSALINVDGEELWVRRGTDILNGQCSVRSLRINQNNTGTISIRCPGETVNLEIRDYLDKNNVGLEDSVDPDFDSYFSEANKTVRELVRDYPSVLKDNKQVTYAEEALHGLIVLAGEKNKRKTQLELIDLFINEYTTSPLIEDVRMMKARIFNYDYGNSVSEVYVSNKFRTISVVEFKSKGEGKSSVDLRVGSELKTMEKGDEAELRNEDGEKIRIRNIFPRRVEIEYLDKDGRRIGSVRDLREGDFIRIGGVDVSLRDLDIEEVAHVEIIPDVKRTETLANFTFRIGVEKRAIKLNPEKTKEMLENLNKSIEKWENTNERLGNLIEGWKGACFATSSVLMLKTMVSGLDGESIARQKVMQRYKSICDAERGEQSRTACYNKYNNEINDAVQKMTVAINEVNKNMESAQEGNVQEEGLFGKGIINNTEYKEKLKDNLGRDWKYNVPLGGEDSFELNVNDLRTIEQIQSALLLEELESQGLSKGDAAYDSAKEELDSSLRNVALFSQENQLARVAAQDNGVESRHVVTIANVDTVRNQWSGLYGKDVGGVPDQYKNDKVQIVATTGVTYLVVLSQTDKNGYSGVSKVLKKSGNGYVEENNQLNIPESLKNDKSIFYSKTSDGQCKNSFREGSAQISFYESGQNKGLPAVVPFDLDNGWYVRIPNSGGTALDSSPKGYTAAAEARYFYICNVGENNLMESTDRDLCQSFDVNTISLVDTFQPCPSMSKREVNDLFVRAQRAIREAASQYGSTGDYRILSQKIGRGAPATETNGLECQDFMSPEDCNLMFNVCDPVICPSSRCDLGGRLPVSNVVQSGIIGSVALCLPNWPDVKVPVCLTGIHAGIDSFVQILKSERSCLQQNLETGEHVGICDEITSVYKCEFFWNQLSPLMNVIVPRTIDALYSGGFSNVRGGGEYTNVVSAWDNLQNSVDYFQNNYAQNAFRAFQLKNVEEAGGEFCRAFIGTSLPTSADAIDSLLEPESPYQFYARFDENVFTDVTVPPTSQYKVYYNIYAGNDQGIYYRIYLKNPPASSYYTTRQEVYLKSGYVVRGSSVDETLDFTAPAGYKELCVEVNDEIHCGFKQVTTSFAINYVQDKYVQDQVESDIKTERECISGTSSALSLANLNLQSSANEIVNPEISLNGIVRICATTNPGSGVVKESDVSCISDVNCRTGYKCNKPVGSDRGFCENNEGIREKRSSRWIDVGYCGDESIRCFLDVESVRSDLERIEAIEGVSTSVLDEQRNLIENTRKDLESTRKTLEEMDKKIRELNVKDLSIVEVKYIEEELNSIIGDVEEEIPGSGTDVDRANALALKAELYNKIVGESRGGTIPVPQAREPSEEVEEGGEEGVTNLNDDLNSEIKISIGQMTSLMKNYPKCDCEDKCEDYARDILSISILEETDPLLVLSLMIQESGCNYEAISLAEDPNKKSYGLMQINAETFGPICSGKLSSGRDTFSVMRNSENGVTQNIECGIKILKNKYNLYKDGLNEKSVKKFCDNKRYITKYASYREWEAALRGYNGWGCVDSPKSANVNFVEEVSKIFYDLRSDLNEPSSVSNSED